jgi:hypothetical protein
VKRRRPPNKNFPTLIGAFVFLWDYSLLPASMSHNAYGKGLRWERGGRDSFLADVPFAPPLPAPTSRGSPGQEVKIVAGAAVDAFLARPLFPRALALIRRMGGGTAGRLRASCTRPRRTP